MAPLDIPLILSAAPFEAAPLVDRLSKHGLKFDYQCFGIGSIHSAWRSKDIAPLASNRPVILLGSVGAFWKFSEPFLVKAREVHWKPTCVVEKRASLIEGIEPPWQCDEKSLFPNFPRQGDIYTSPAITISESAFKCQNTFENLELYSLRPIYDASKSFDAFFCVTNEVGPEGRSQWKENFRAGAELCGSVVFDWLEKTIVKILPP